MLLLLLMWLYESFQFKFSTGNWPKFASEAMSTQMPFCDLAADSRRRKEPPR